jgi:hypothetical protein
MMQRLVQMTTRRLSIGATIFVVLGRWSLQGVRRGEVERGWEERGGRRGGRGRRGRRGRRGVEELK